MGEPACHYDFGAMGSLARGNLALYSDLEWCILIEHSEHAPYFARLAHLVEIQIIGLGEDPAIELPVFTCIAKKHRSGLHVDTGGNPTRLCKISSPLLNNWQGINYPRLSDPIP